jgi:hypothetical protein
MEHSSLSQSHVLTGAPSRGTRSGVVRKVLAWLVAAALLLSSGCIFSPRDAEGPPGEGGEIPWVTPTDTDAVLENLAAALAGEGISNYLDCLQDEGDGGFRFHVDPQDSLGAGNEAEDRYANWVRDDEATYVTGVFLDSAEGMSLTFTPVVGPDEGQDDTYRQEDYELTIVWQSGNHQPGESVTYRGRATFYLRRDDTELWSIYKWVDRRASSPGTGGTWGVLRGDYRE